MELKNRNKYLYNSILIKKFISNLAKSGKVQKIENLLFLSLKNLKFKVRLNPLIIFLFLLSEIKPCIELKTLRLGSVSYQIPVPLLHRKQFFRAAKLLAKSIKGSAQKQSLGQKIQIEFLQILQQKSSLYKQNQDLYQTASNNRTFAHYR